jgi:hypothetical protein
LTQFLPLARDGSHAQRQMTNISVEGLLNLYWNDALTRRLLNIMQVQVDMNNWTARIQRWYDQYTAKEDRLSFEKTICEVVRQMIEADDAMMKECNEWMGNDERADK